MSKSAASTSSCIRRRSKLMKPTNRKHRGCCDVILAGVRLLGLFVTCSSLGLGQVNVLERGYNKFRTGANANETVLTPANVASGSNRFHKQFVIKVDGKIEGSPL